MQKQELLQHIIHTYCAEHHILYNRKDQESSWCQSLQF